MQDLKFKGIKKRSALLLFLALTLLLGYVLPVITEQAPSGTDVYTHIFYTNLILDSKSLNAFYEKSIAEGYITYDYPFGLWLFGSLITGITGVSVYIISYLLPLLLIFITVLLYYVYSGIFINKPTYRVLTVLLFLSMPIVSITLLEYRTSVLSITPLLAIFYLMLNKGIPFRKSFLLIILFVFVIGFTHTGTYMFLLYFAFIYFLIHTLWSGELDKRAYILISSLLIIYALTTTIFPHIHPQYTDKGQLVLTVGDLLSSKLHIPWAIDFSQIFYQKIFVDRSLFDVLLWCGFIYAIATFLLFLRQQTLKLVQGNWHGRHLAAIPFIGNFGVSHSVISTPFWIGPLHSLLTLFGVFKMDTKGKSLLLASLLVTVLPGSTTVSYSGALREIIYLFLIIPVTSALGIQYLIEKIDIRKRNGKLLAFFLFLMVFSASIISPLAGNLYYKPPISGSESEKSGLIWLGGIGNSQEGATGIGYRHMINVYANKLNPESTTVESGMQTRNFLKNLRNIYLSNNTEEYVEDMYYNSQVKYFVASPRVLRNFNAVVESLTIDHNTLLDKSYSGQNYFGIYTRVQPKTSVIYGDKVDQRIDFDEQYPAIQDAGSDFLIETKAYRLKIGKNTPKIKYMGDTKVNLLGEGSISDSIRLSWYGKEMVNEYQTYLLPELNFSVNAVGNQLIYKTVLTNENQSEYWATLTIRYVFYEGAMKNEIIIANDWLPLGLPMKVSVSTGGFLPLPLFTYTDWYGEKKEKRIYPAEDTIKIKDKKFKTIFLNNGEKGIYFKYDKTAPYPGDIMYKGSTIYSNYSSIDLSSTEFVDPGKVLHITKYISIGRENEAEEAIARYSSFSIYPYQNASIPIMLTSYIEDMNKLSGINLDHVLEAHEGLRATGIAYTEGLSMKEGRASQGLIENLSSYGSSFMGYIDMPIDQMTQSAAIYGLRLEGVLPESYYDPETVKEAINSSLLFMETSRIIPPIQEFYQEGLRYPQFAYYRGNETDMVMFPVSTPTSSSLKSTEDLEDTIATSKSVIDSVIDNEDTGVFLWKSEDIGDPQYINGMFKVVKYAKDRGMTFTTPAEVARHLILMKNVSLAVSMNVDTLTLYILNANTQPVYGASFKAIMPDINNECPYLVRNGKLERSVRQKTSCIFYISTDLYSRENRVIGIEPEITRGMSTVDLVKGPLQGEIILAIKDKDNNSVYGATVSIGNSKYLSDSTGTVKTNLKRGRYVIKVEKPGLETMVYDLEVKGGIYYLEKIPTWVYLVVAFVAVIVVKARKQFYHII